MADWDYDELASQLLRVLRGSRSQGAFARRLGYKSNVIYSWEAGRAFPTAARMFVAASKVGCDIEGALVTLHRNPTGTLQGIDPTQPEGVARFLRILRGRTTIKELAAATGASRFVVSRWLKGETEPRLPDFLRLVDVITLRLLDFVAVLVDPRQMPALKDAWKDLELARQATYRLPWSQGVLRVLESDAYQRLQTHPTGWIASKLGITPEQEIEALTVLLATGQAERNSGKYVPSAASPVIDTRRDVEGARMLRAFWAEVALERLKGGDEGVFAHNVFGVSQRDYQRIRDLQKAYYQEVRAIVSESEPVESVVLLNLQLVPLFKP